jgi:hypothetical protein
MRAPLESIHFLCKSTENSWKKNWSSDLLRKGHTFPGQAEFNVDLKKINLA